MADLSSSSAQPIQDCDGSIPSSDRVVAHSPVPPAELQELQSLAVMGELAQAVAHDFNNIVSATHLHLDLLIQDPALGANHRDALRLLEEEMNRAAGLTRQLLAFNRRRFVSTDEPVDLNQAMGEILRLLRHLVRENVAISFDRSPEECRIQSNIGQLEKLILSLCLILRDALPKGGQLRLETRRMTGGEPTTTHEIKGTGEYIRLSMTASRRHGEEFPPESPCPRGSEDGWKLKAAREIIQRHRGWIAIDRSPTRLEVQVYFPRTGESQDDSADCAEIKGGTETILLVEDEAFLRRVSATSLRKLGYAVLDAADGEGARKLWGKHHATIDLLLSDLILPDAQSGHDLAQLFISQKPSLRVILSSGNHAELNDFTPIAGRPIFPIVKPYNRSCLAQRVRECLDSSA